MAKQRRSLEGKVVAITGGARGIGASTATALARRGCRVALGDVDIELARETAARLGPGVTAIALDVTDRDSFEAFLDQAESELGGLDVVINNAGIMPVTKFDEETDDSIRRQLEINFYGVVVGTQLAVRRLRARGSGHIVNVASQAGKAAVPGIATYSGTKHAVVGLSEAVRAELRGSGVEVHCVMPTIVNTELGSGVGKRMIRQIEPEDVAEAIVEALEVGRFEVYVPRHNAALLKVSSMLPRRLREPIARLMGLEELMFDIKPGARSAYEARAAGGDSAPERETKLSA